MLDGNQKKQIRQTISSPQWAAFELLANEMCDKIKEDSVVRNTEWDTLQAVLLAEGQLRGIRNFIKECYEHASKTE